MKRSYARGFTLIEMLAAVAVLAIAMSAILSGMVRYADNAAYLREKTVALWVAHNRMTEIHLDPAWPDIGKSDGEMEMAGTQWKWKAVVQKTPDDHLRRIDLSVLSPSREGEVVTLSAFISDVNRE